MFVIPREFVVLRVDKSLFSNVVTAAQRTANLPGGAIRNLPGGASIDGMKGVESFSAEVADAKKEFELGRIHNALARVRQIEMQFNSIVGRWNAQTGGVLASARQGKQALPAQKLNEIKNAQSKMRQLTAPATKAFRDLVTALEHAVASQGDAASAEPDESPTPTNGVGRVKVAPSSNANRADVEERATVDRAVTTGAVTTGAIADSGQGDVPDLNRLGRFADKYRFGPKLQLKVAANQKRQISPKLEEGRFYFVEGLSPSTVIRVREIRSRSVLVFDALNGNETLWDTFRLRTLLNQGIWLLMPWSKAST